MAVLDYLACRPGAVVTRQELEDALWAGVVVGYDALSNTIIKLRKAFGDKARAPEVIETIPKTGYRLIADVSVPAPADRESAPPIQTDGERPRRKLAAILCATVAEHTRMSREFENETHPLQQHYFDIFRTRIETCNGRIIRSGDDTVLAIFDTVVDAVDCAHEVQYEIYRQNETQPAGKGLRFRIGIDSGDVFENRDQVHGDGVSVAERLQELTPPGGVCVSESIRASIGRDKALAFNFVGEHQVKGIPDRVRVYSMGLPWATADIDDTPPQMPGRPSVVVMPFDNMNGDAEQDYFSDGLTEDITTDLSKLSGLLVIARNSSFAYKGKPIDVGTIGRELGVRYLLEGSVRRSGDRIRINAQLIDCTNSGHIWADRYDRHLSDIFSVQDEVTRQIVTAISPSLTGTEQDRLEHRETPNFEAYDYFLKGREQSFLDDEHSNAMARQLLQTAIDLDPGFSSAYALLARCRGLAYINNWGEQEAHTMSDALELGERAVDLNPDNPRAHFAVGAVALWLKMHDYALTETGRAIEIDPNFAEGYAALGMVQIYAGDSDKALVSLRTAMRLDPHYRDIYLHLSGQACFHLGRYDEAIALLKRRLVRKPDSDISRVLLAAAYGHLDEGEMGHAEWCEALRVNPEYSIHRKRDILPYRNPADFQQVIDGLRKAGIAVE